MRYLYRLLAALIFIPIVAYMLTIAGWSFIITFGGGR